MDSPFPVKNITLVLIVSVIGLVMICSIAKATYRGFTGHLNALPGSLLSKVSPIKITIAGVQGHRAQTLLKLHKQYGPIVRIGPNEVSVGSWRYLRPIYADAKTSPKYASFYSAATFVGLPNIFSMINKHQHAARRKLGAAPYSLASTTSLKSLVLEKADVLVQRLISEAALSPSKTADAFKMAGLFSFEVVCKTGFAKDFAGSQEDDSLAMLKAMDASAMTMIFDQAMPWLKKSGLATQVPGNIGASYRSFEYWEARSRVVVNDFLTSTKETDRYLLTPFMKGRDSFLDRNLDKEELVEEAMGLMFAGSGTTSTTLTYLLYSLSRPENVNIQQQLRAEVQGVSSDDLTTLRNLPYLNAVIKETFRLYPTIISTLPRVLDEPLVIESHVLPVGTVVGMQNLVHHRDPEVFPNPDRFIPERWLNSTNEMEGSLTPFSIGRRNCIGQNLAWVELHLAVSQIFSKVELKLGGEMKEEDMEMEDRFNIAPRGKKLMVEVRRL